ncbi:MAG: helix-turn-helix transcriptional regulator [Deltaproteobacteria bacterium]|nr:helix-turn-helix transcriptional regulator [Deltaproteobacteria bacterium]
MKNLVKLLKNELGSPTFGGFLCGARASKDLSQVDMAQMLGISRSTLCDIEKGRHFVSAALAAQIARKCGFSEKIAVKAALQDQLRKARLKMRVEVLAA